MIRLITCKLQGGASAALYPRLPASFEISSAQFKGLRFVCNKYEQYHNAYCIIRSQGAWKPWIWCLEDMVPISTAPINQSSVERYSKATLRSGKVNESHEV